MLSASSTRGCALLELMPKAMAKVNSHSKYDYYRWTKLNECAYKSVVFPDDNKCDGKYFRICGNINVTREEGLPTLMRALKQVQEHVTLQEAAADGGFDLRHQAGCSRETRACMLRERRLASLGSSSSGQGDITCGRPPDARRLIELRGASDISSSSLIKPKNNAAVRISRSGVRPPAALVRSHRRRNRKMEKARR